jgi:hypothetical protein
MTPLAPERERERERERNSLKFACLVLRMRWAGHVARRGRREGYTGCWWENLREKGHWGDPDGDGRIILRRIFRKLEGWCGLDGVGSR